MSLSPRVSVNVTERGTVAWDKLRGDSREKLRRLLDDPELPRQLGIAQPATGAAPAAVSVDPMLCGVLYDSLASIGVAIARATGATVEEANVLRFTAEEKAMLAQPTANVLAKYAGAWDKWSDEIALALALTTIVGAKAAAFQQMRGARAATTPAPVKAAA